MSAHQVRSPTNRARKVSNRKISKLHLTVGPTNAYSRCATAQPDTSVEMDTQAPEFEKRFEEFDEDTRGAVAFSAVADNSKGLATALRADIHLTRTYRRAIDELRRLRGGKILELLELQIEPEAAPITTLNTTPAAAKFSTEPKNITPEPAV